MSPFECFLRFSDWLGARLGRNHSIALVSLAEHLYHYLATEISVLHAAEILKRDWFRGGIKRERLPFLEEIIQEDKKRGTDAPRASKRQQRHLKT